MSVCGGGGDTDRGREAAERSLSREQRWDIAPSRPGFILRRPCPLRLLGQTNPAICPLSHSGVASQAQPPALSQSPGAMQIASSVLQTGVGFRCYSSRPSPASFFRCPPPPSSRSRPGSCWDEGSAGRLMHMQIIFLIPPSSPALPFSPAPRFGPLSSHPRLLWIPRLVERLDVQFSEPWYQAAASRRRPYRGKGGRHYT